MPAVGRLHPHDPHPAATLARPRVGPEPHPPLAAHPGGAIRGVHRKLLLDLHGGRFAEPHHKVAAVRPEFREKGIVLAVVAVAHVSGPALPLLLPSIARTEPARADLGQRRLVLEQMKAQVQAHRPVGGARPPAAIERPVHARQRPPERTVLGQPVTPASRSKSASKNAGSTRLCASEKLLRLTR